MTPPIAFAHRGARKELPENTLAAFRRALELGSTGLESDAWLTADGEVVLAHDPVVRRGLRRLNVRKSTAEQLAGLDVPRLADLYATLGTGYEVSLDVKHREAARPVIDVARAAGAGERLWLCSPEVDLLAELRPETPDVKLVHSVRKTTIPQIERHASDLAELRVDAMNMHHTDWSSGLVSLFHKFGVDAWAWDVQEVRHLRAMLDMGVDAVFCDRPDRMVAVIGEWSARG